jgi:hypothetical protein
MILYELLELRLCTALRYGRKPVTDESVGMWEKAVVANYKVLFLTLTGRTGETNRDIIVHR